jgi:hypothetical protein
VLIAPRKTVTQHTPILLTLKTSRKAGEIQIIVTQICSCRQFIQIGAFCRPLSAIREVKLIFFISGEVYHLGPMFKAEY